jgi:UDP-N-acetylglucosamine transferase subunit ALG13
MASLIVFGNSERKFLRMVSAVRNAFALFPKPVVIQAGVHQEDFKEISQEATVLSVISYVDFDNLMTRSDVIVCHGGVGVTQSALRLGRHPAVFCRRKKFNEHIDDHQLDWCSLLCDQGLATCVEGTTGLESYLRKGHFANQDLQHIDEFLTNSWLRQDLQQFIRETLKGAS